MAKNRCHTVIPATPVRKTLDRFIKNYEYKLSPSVTIRLVKFRGFALSLFGPG